MSVRFRRTGTAPDRANDRSRGHRNAHEDAFTHRQLVKVLPDGWRPQILAPAHGPFLLIRQPLLRGENRRMHRITGGRSVQRAIGGDAPYEAADGDSAPSSACCCSLVRLVLSTVPPNLAISGNTRSWLVVRAMTKSAEPPGAIALATSLIHL